MRRLIKITLAFNPTNLIISEQIIRALLQTHFMMTPVGIVPFDKELDEVIYHKDKKELEFVWKKEKE